MKEISYRYLDTGLASHIHKVTHTYSPFPRRRDSKCSSECQSKSSMAVKFKSTSPNRETQILRYLAIQIRNENLVSFEFLCISRYQFKLRFWLARGGADAATRHPKFRDSIPRTPFFFCFRAHWFESTKILAVR